MATRAYRRAVEHTRDEYTAPRIYGAIESPHTRTYTRTRTHTRHTYTLTHTYTPTQTVVYRHP